MDEDITNRPAKFRNQINGKNTCRIPLRFLCKICKVNHPIKFDIIIICKLETDMAKNLAANQQVANVGTPDAQIIWHNVPFIQYRQLRLNDNFRQYLETNLVAEKVFQMGIQKTPLQKSYELSVGMQTYTVEFTAANRQFE